MPNPFGSLHCQMCGDNYSPGERCSCPTAEDLEAIRQRERTEREKEPVSLCSCGRPKARGARWCDMCFPDFPH